MIDLGNWASESYKVSAPISDVDEPSFHTGEEKPSPSPDIPE
ncbi:MAG: hypothetical protein O7E51_11335 [Acidobacteria bacterium]|nr:hypothetical protein [Acidobacteriota bacterium]